MVDDLLNVVSGKDLDKELREKLRDYLSKAKSELDRADWDEESVRRVDSILTGMGGAASYQYRTVEDYKRIIQSKSAFSNLSQYEDLRSFLANNYGFDVDQRYLSAVLLDAFGDHGQYLENWEARVDSVGDKILADIHGHHRGRYQVLLQGLECGGESAIIFEGQDYEVSFEPITRDTKIVWQTGMSIHSMMDTDPGFASTVLSISGSGEAVQSDIQTYIGFLERILRLYGVANVSSTLKKYTPISYRGMSMRSSSHSSRDSLPSLTINKHDERRLRELNELLEPLYDFESREFDAPLRPAFKHYDESLKQRTSYHSSLSFAVICLEALYKQYTNGGGSSSDVARYAALLIGQVSRNRPGVVKSQIDEAYEERNSWAHGGAASSSADKELQDNLWNYLRISIVVFAWLWEEGYEQEGQIPFENILIDQQTRKGLTSKLESFDVGDYIPVPSP